MVQPDMDILRSRIPTIYVISVIIIHCSPHKNYQEELKYLRALVNLEGSNLATLQNSSLLGRSYTPLHRGP